MTLTVDLHHHVIPDFYWQASNEDGNAAGGITPPHWSFDGAIAYLDEARIDLAVLSISTPGVHFGDDAAARVLARRVNEYLAEIKRDRPDRFGAFAVLPLPDVEGTLEQIAYAFDVLELDGVSILTNASGSYLGDDRFADIFAELQRRAAVAFIHPTASPDPIAHTLGLPDALLDYPVDTSRAIAKLHYSNTFARTPDVKYVFAHAGGTIPFVASRFARRRDGRHPGLGRAGGLRRWPPAPLLGHRVGIRRSGAPSAAIGRGTRERGVRDRLPVPARRHLDRRPAPAREHSGARRRRASAPARRVFRTADPASSASGDRVLNRHARRGHHHAGMREPEAFSRAGGRSQLDHGALRP
jgi:predicted TIM-barrel fold metal-dependent hydrolase